MVGSDAAAALGGVAGSGGGGASACGDIGSDRLRVGAGGDFLGLFFFGLIETAARSLPHIDFFFLGVGASAGAGVGGFAVATGGGGGAKSSG